MHVAEMVVGCAHRRPRSDEAITGCSRDDVEVQMEDVLPAGRSIRLHGGQPLRCDAVPQERRDRVNCSGDVGERIGVDVPDVCRVDLRDDERVSVG